MGKRVEAVALSLLLCVGQLTAARGAGAETAQTQPVRAMFINVGKADAALIAVGDARYLVDTGSKESADALLRALTFFAVTRLDGVIVTHIDSDHVGGLKALLKSDIAVDRLYAATLHNAKSTDRHPVYRQAEKYGIPLTWLSAGDAVPVGGEARFQVLGPLSHDLTNENNNSLVLRLVTPQGDMLLAGDMELPEEAELIAAGLVAAAPVLKVGHHGEGDASGSSFLYTVKPQVAVISTDSAAEPDTPDPGVLGRLWNIGAEVFVTQKATCCVQVTLAGGNAVGRLVDYSVR